MKSNATIFIILGITLLINMYTQKISYERLGEKIDRVEKRMLEIESKGYDWQIDNQKHIKFLLRKNISDRKYHDDIDSMQWYAIMKMKHKLDIK